MTNEDPGPQIPSPVVDRFDCEAARNPELCAQVAEIRAINLGNALDAPFEGAWGIVLESRDFDISRDMGFNSLRVPVRWSAHAALEEPYTIDADFFARVDWVLEEARRRELLVILNVHHYEELIADPHGFHGERFITLWRQIAERYAARSVDELWFEPLNEPNGALDRRRWNELVAEVLPAIRETNPSRPVVIGGPEWNNASSMRQLELPDDDRNLVLTFHYYEPFHFTHQGASWANLEHISNVGWEWEEHDEIDRHFRDALRQGEAVGLPVFLGEFGAFSTGAMADRARWTSYVRRVSEVAGFGWAYWELRSGFGVYDSATGAPRRELADALFRE